MRRLAFFCLLAGALSIAGAAVADEGMWTFDNFPAAAVKAKYGVAIDKPWLDHVRAAAVRLSVGCSASIVSRDGLVMTNHHCVEDCVQDLSNGSRDLVKNGYQAAKREDELRCPGMQAEVLLSSAESCRGVFAVRCRVSEHLIDVYLIV
jgi:hypothetical protein